MTSKRDVESTVEVSLSTRLREAHRQVTRQRISDAAREIFHRDGYRDARLEEVAQLAGLSRSTLYQHFGDKESILTEVAEPYRLGLLALVEEMPGPNPTRNEIDVWIARLARFVATERVPTILIVELANGEDSPAPLQQIGSDLLTALANRYPAFSRALQDGPERTLWRAWADTILREMGWACLRYARDEGAASVAALQVAADLIYLFVHEKFRWRDEDVC
ncbi:MAG TPA: TetR/AcrR family transcriptional regulator [Sphingobium sp.]|uniref:TetR/AcrR family transcriptional regulator n=1 Tax=Sphingobium sp. TaxID=1912891 RepID=UPI002ECFDAF8